MCERKVIPEALTDFKPGDEFGAGSAFPPLAAVLTQAPQHWWYHHQPHRPEPWIVLKKSKEENYNEEKGEKARRKKRHHKENRRQLTNEDFGSRVVKANAAKNGGAVVGDLDHSRLAV